MGEHNVTEDLDLLEKGRKTFFGNNYFRAIRRKTFFAFFFAFVCLTAISTFVMVQVVSKKFETLEDKKVKTNLQRVNAALNREADYLIRLLSDWSRWDDTYNFVSKPNPEYIKSNLPNDTFIDLRLNFIQLSDVSGKRVWAKSFDLVNEELIPIQEELVDIVSANSKVITDALTGKRTSGLIALGDRIILLGAHPVYKSDGSGPIMGVLLMGRYYNGEPLEILRAQTHLPIQIRTLPAQERGETSGEARIKVTSKELIIGRLVYKDFFDNKSLEIELETPRTLYQTGLSTTQILLSITVLTGFILFLFTGLAADFIVLSPIKKLTNAIEKTKTLDDLDIAAFSNRNDEIGTLTRAIVKMLATIEEDRRSLQNLSYRSGMSEMAREVLHNVRNALSPLVINLETSRKECATASIKEIKLAHAEIGAKTTNPARREELVKLILLSNEMFMKKAHDATQRAENGLDTIAYTRSILNSYQELAEASQWEEIIDIKRIINDAIRFTHIEDKRVDIPKIGANIDNGLNVKASPVILLQLLTNIMTNAMESVNNSGRNDGFIEVSASSFDKGGVSVAGIEVRDNGLGIDMADTSELFTRGFTTKEKGSGIGLHWCSNAVNAMGGSINASSDGPGKGAVFSIYLPLAK
jgi:sensor domain CHASE-containing protein